MCPQTGIADAVDEKRKVVRGLRVQPAVALVDERVEVHAAHAARHDPSLVASWLLLLAVPILRTPQARADVVAHTHGVVRDSLVANSL